MVSWYVYWKCEENDRPRCHQNGDCVWRRKCVLLGQVMMSFVSSFHAPYHDFEEQDDTAVGKAFGRLSQFVGKLRFRPSVICGSSWLLLSPCSKLSDQWVSGPADYSSICFSGLLWMPWTWWILETTLWMFNCSISESWAVSKKNNFLVDFKIIIYQMFNKKDLREGSRWKSTLFGICVEQWPLVSL